MSILGLALGAAVPGGGLIYWAASALLGADKVAKGLGSVGTWIAANWKPLLIIAAIAAAVIYVLILRGEVSGRDKTIAGQAALITAVTAEVDRGINGKSKPADAPAYIRAFVDNVRTLDATLSRQTTALNAAKADANAHVAAAHEAAQPTQAQQQREAVRQKIVDPARTTGLTQDEWGKL